MQYIFLFQFYLFLLIYYEDEIMNNNKYKPYLNQKTCIYVYCKAIYVYMY